MTADVAHLIRASIRPHVLDDVVEALDEVGVRELVVAESLGFTDRARRSVYRGVPYVALDERSTLEVVTHHRALDLVVDLIAANAWTGSRGDGSVWTSRLDRAVDIRSWAEQARVLGR